MSFYNNKQQGETCILNQFQAYLVQRGYREFSISGNPSTAIDYAWRVAKVCEKENYTTKQLDKKLGIVHLNLDDISWQESSNKKNFMIKRTDKEKKDYSIINSKLK